MIQHEIVLYLTDGFSFMSRLIENLNATLKDLPQQLRLIWQFQ